MEDDDRRVAAAARGRTSVRVLIRDHRVLEGRQGVHKAVDGVR